MTLIGLGIANMIYETLVYKQVETRYELGIDRKLVLMAFLSRLRNFNGCILSLFRVVLNEYSTGFCLLATAYVRYVLVCHPTNGVKSILTESVLYLINPTSFSTRG